MREYHFVQVDVFTDVIFGGNPLAVFPDAEGLSSDEMQKIARELNLSETAFVLPPTDSRADVRVRFFTPTSELPFAGHPTIGTHVALAKLGRYTINGPVTRVFQQVRVGVLPVDLITDGNGSTDRAVMTQDTARHGEIYEDRARIAAALGLSKDDLMEDLPPQVYSTGLPGLIVPVASLDAIESVNLNIAAFTEICKALSVTSASVFTLETLDNAHHAHVRVFAPMLGIMEDPATGSLAGALGSYLLGKGVFEYGHDAST
ncbi:MAG: PhzF family phenazine biosynthesis protein, partial [Chloroflexi bacterium]|nr:PhzF family phenazine biosynthesis protein [Chloroflexota bacterium]